MINWYERLSERNKGMLAIAAGVVLLLNSFGVTWVKVIIFFIALFLILIGLVKLQVHKKVMELMNKKK